jgi:hypothetical protein
MMGVEPTASRATIWRSNQLSYIHHVFFVITGFIILSPATKYIVSRETIFVNPIFFTVDCMHFTAIATERRY